MNKLSKVVFTDIDGTLLRGFITLDFVNYLYENGFFDSIQYQKQIDLMNLFKIGAIDSLIWLKRWASIWGKGIKNKSEVTLAKKARTFFKNYSKFYPSSKNLVKYFHEKGYLVVGVSVGVIEVDELVKKYLNLDEVISSKVEVKNGLYTGKVITKLHTKFGKKNSVLSYSKINAVKLSNCVGIGNSLHDVQFIDLVGLKIALNADSVLLAYASQQNYFVMDYKSVLNDIKYIA